MRPLIPCVLAISLYGQAPDNNNMPAQLARFTGQPPCLVFIVKTCTLLHVAVCIPMYTSVDMFTCVPKCRKSVGMKMPVYICVDVYVDVKVCEHICVYESTCTHV